ncbi:MAG: S8 family serine peptidase [Caldilineaceae bacterium]
MDPLNRAVEALWARGVVVIAAAGNEGPTAESITVPGNDPYIITVGGLNTSQTAGDFSDDSLSSWSATGPTADGFLKPDVLAPGGSIVSFMYNAADDADSAYLALNHPDYSLTEDLFSMSGTSMATAVTSGVVALMLQADPDLTPDEVKFRLMTSARPAIDGEDLAYNLLQQGAGRIWAPDAVLGDFPADVAANTGMDLAQDLAHGYEDEADLPFHYQGPIQRTATEDDVTLYYVTAENETVYALGAADADGVWLSRADAEVLLPSFAQTLAVDAGVLAWAGGATPSAGGDVWADGGYAWAGGGYAWSGGGYAWSGGGYAWSGGGYAWAGGGYAWAGGGYAWAGGGYAWAGSVSCDTGIASTRWVEAETFPAEPTVPGEDGPADDAPPQEEEPAPSDETLTHVTFLPAMFAGR